MASRQFSDDRAASGNRPALQIAIVTIVGLIIVCEVLKLWPAVILLIIAAICFCIDRVTDIRDVKFNVIDLSALIVFIADIVSYQLSSYKPNSFYALRESVFLFLFYCIVRFSVRREQQWVALFCLISILGLILSGEAITRFYISSAELKSYGFTDIVSVKGQMSLSSIEVVTNKWVTIFLAFLPFPFILFLRFAKYEKARWLFVVAALSMAYAALLSLSRGIYFAVISFAAVGTFLLYIYKILPVRRLIIFNALMVLILSVSLLPIAKPVISTLGMFRTVSQKRSFEGRVSAWHASVEMAKTCPIFGVGPMNFAMRYIAFREDEERRELVGNPFNLFLHILTERGAVGLAAYGLLFCSFFYASFRRASRLINTSFRDCVLLLFVTSIVASLVRDMSFSSILTNKGLCLLLWLMFAISSQIVDLESESS
jgi:O-antigen ligase